LLRGTLPPADAVVKTLEDVKIVLKSIPNIIDISLNAKETLTVIVWSFFCTL
jgi:hypothetical protein